MEDKPLQEKCGLVAFYTARYSKKLSFTLLAAGGVQHRGQHGAGLAIQTKKGLLSHTGNGLLREIFTPPVTEKFDQTCQWTMIHCRYGTYGGYIKNNLQPCVVNTDDDTRIAVIHNGEFVAANKMRKRIGTSLPEGTSDSYIFTLLLSQAKGDSWEEKILTTLSSVKGAYSLIIGINDAVYAARDPYGIRPLMIGYINGGWLIASETHAFNKVGAKIRREIQRGEVIRIDRQGISTIKRGNHTPSHFCDFEWVYFSRPDSLLPTNTQEDKYPKSWISITNFREKCGAILANEHPIKDASFVVGIPDSGIAMATGYANTLKIPYRQAIIRDHFDPYGSHRLFMKDESKDTIAIKVLGKLSVIPQREIWQGAKVVICDDSIVRGNVSRQITKAIWDLGAKEIHWIIGFPPVMYRCHLGVSMRTREELIAAQHEGDWKKIAKSIGTTSINYISIKGFIQARSSTLLNSTANPKELFLVNGGCGGCVTGLYPISQNGQVYSFSPPQKSYKRIAVLISNAGTGTNLQAIIDAIESDRLKAKIVAVISDTPDAYGLVRAKKHHLPVLIINKNSQLKKFLKKEGVDLVVLAGWKKIVNQPVIKAFANKILNIHPGLIPDSPKEIIKNPDGSPGLWNRGKFTEKAIKNFFEKKTSFAGSSVHFLTPDFDFGPVLGRCFEKILPGDTVESLYGRLKKKENQIYIEALTKLCNS